MIPLNSRLGLLKRSAIRRFTELARQTPDCAMLTIGEPDFDTPAPICAAAVSGLDLHETHYAPNQGTPALRKAIAEAESRRGRPTGPEEVLVTAGASEALFLALFGTLDPGDEVIVPIPAFPLYETLITLAGAKMVPLDLTKTGFQIRRDTLAQLVTDKTKAIVLNSPNNPTGCVLDETSLAAVKDCILGKPIFLVWDGVYDRLAENPCPDPSLDPDLREQVLLCQSFSKPWAMTGWRIGYLSGPEPVLQKLLLLHAGVLASVPTFLQSACITALETDTAAMAEVYRRRREYVCQRLQAMGISFPRPQGAFYVFGDISGFGMDSETFCTRMIQEGKVAAVPGSCFGTEGYLRISCCYDDEVLKTGLDRMEAFINHLREETL